MVVIGKGYQLDMLIILKNLYFNNKLIGTKLVNVK